jgi:hypothetical protein
MSCKWAARVSFKAKIRSNNRESVREKDKTWILIITCGEHTHAMALNPLAYIIYRKRRLKYQKAMELARTHKEAFFKYGASNRVMCHDTYLSGDRSLG